MITLHRFSVTRRQGQSVVKLQHRKSRDICYKYIGYHEYAHPGMQVYRCSYYEEAQEIRNTVVLAAFLINMTTKCAFKLKEVKAS